MATLAEINAEIERRRQAELEAINAELARRTVGDSVIDVAPLPAAPATGDETLLEGLGKAAENIPHSLANRARELEQVVSDPIGTVKTLGRLGLGALEMARNPLLSPDESENAHLVRRAGSALLESFRPENMINDPTAPIANVAGAVAPLAPKGSLLGRVANIAADPIVSGLGAGAKVGSKVGGAVARGAGNLAAEGLGFTTGKGAPRIEQAVAAGREGQGRSFLSALADKTSKKQIGRETIEGLRAEEVRLGAAKGDFVEANAAAPIDLRGLRQEVMDILGEQGITELGRRDRLELRFPEEFDPTAARKVEQAVGSLDELGDFTDLQTLDSKKQAIGDLFRAGKRDGVAVSRINKAVRERLNQVDGYAEVNKDFADLQTFLDEVSDDIGIQVKTKDRPKGKPKKAGRGITDAIKEGAEDDLATLGRIEEITGIPLRAQAAGQGLSQTLPGGLVARGLGAGAIGGAATGFVPIATLPLFSPRVVGAMAVSVGTGQRQAQQAISALQRAARVARLPQSITVGQAIERLTEEDDSFLARLGQR